MMKGDRVLVALPHQPLGKSYYGIIVGEGREGRSWQIIKEGTKYPRGINKSFCHLAKSIIRKENE